MGTIKGYVDRLSPRRVAGWACLYPNFEKVWVVVKVNGKVRYKVLADKFREDLLKAKIGDGCFSYDIELSDVSENDIIEVFAINPLTNEEVKLPKSKGKSYQSFIPGEGASDSWAKLERIGLPINLDGKSVLDIGCNEGFFCWQAKLRGASRVVGIDKNPEFINRAKERFKDLDIEFICSDWWNLPDEKFDYILFLSGLHWEPRPKEFLEFLKTRLKPDGTIIIECGVVNDWKDRFHFKRVANFFFRHPTFGLLYKHIFSGFSVRFIGKSVSPPVDPIPRYIFHLKIKKPIFLIIEGETNIGKTNLALTISQYKYPVVSFDDFIGNILSEKGNIINDTSLSNSVYQQIAKQEKLGDIVALFDRNKQNKLFIEEFINEFSKLIPKNEELVIIEGLVFKYEEVRNELVKKLSQYGEVWLISKIQKIR